MNFLLHWFLKDTYSPNFFKSHNKSFLSIFQNLMQNYYCFKTPSQMPAALCFSSVGERIKPYNCTLYKIPLTLCRGLPMTLHPNTQSAAQTWRVIHPLRSHIWLFIDRLWFPRFFLPSFFLSARVLTAAWRNFFGASTYARFILFYHLHLFLLFITGLIVGNKVCGTLSRMRNSHVLIFSPSISLWTVNERKWDAQLLIYFIKCVSRSGQTGIMLIIIIMPFMKIVLDHLQKGN